MIFVAMHLVRFWHDSDVPQDRNEVRFQGLSGRATVMHPKAVLDPQRTSAT